MVDTIRMESTALDIAKCSACDRRVLVAWALDDNDQVLEVCAHCDTPFPTDSERKQMGGYALRALSYDIEGEGPDTEGCGIGGGGCGSGGGCG